MRPLCGAWWCDEVQLRCAGRRKRWQRTKSSRPDDFRSRYGQNATVATTTAPLSGRAAHLAHGEAGGCAAWNAGRWHHARYTYVITRHGPAGYRGHIHWGYRWSVGAAVATRSANWESQLRSHQVTDDAELGVTRAFRYDAHAHHRLVTVIWYPSLAQLVGGSRASLG